MTAGRRCLRRLPRTSSCRRASPSNSTTSIASSPSRASCRCSIPGSFATRPRPCPRWVTGSRSGRRPARPPATIEAILPRRSKFSRKVAGELTEEQIVAANIDTVFLVMGLDGDYNPRRLERYLLLAYESGASPVVILNKSDVADHLAEDMDEIQALAVGIPVHAISAKEQQRHRRSLPATSAPARPARCSARREWGSRRSSTRCSARRRFKTRDVRAHDSRGRHTTRHRNLILLPERRGLLVDTPGMRELQLWTGNESARETFDDIIELAAGCHFTDCRHKRRAALRGEAGRRRGHARRRSPRRILEVAGRVEEPRGAQGCSRADRRQEAIQADREVDEEVLQGSRPVVRLSRQPAVSGSPRRQAFLRSRRITCASVNCGPSFSRAASASSRVAKASDQNPPSHIFGRHQDIDRSTA